MAKEDELGQLAAELRVTAFQLVRRLRNESQVEGLTDAQLSVLMHLSRIGPSTPGQLAEYERVSAPSMNRTVNGLAAAGAVRRVADPDDGRRVLVEVTERGAQIVQAARKRRSAWLRAELKPLSKKDRAALARAAELLGGMLAK